MGNEGSDVPHEEEGNHVVWKKAETSHDTYTGGCPSHAGETKGFDAASVRNKVP